jgi:hypothetical protein
MALHPVRMKYVAGLGGGPEPGVLHMTDVLFVILTIVVFALLALATRGAERL